MSHMTNKKDELNLYANNMGKWMKEWMEMVETVDDIIASNGFFNSNFQLKEGF